MKKIVRAGKVGEFELSPVYVTSSNFNSEIEFRSLVPEMPSEVKSLHSISKGSTLWSNINFYTFPTYITSFTLPASDQTQVLGLQPYP